MSDEEGGVEERGAYYKNDWEPLIQFYLETKGDGEGPKRKVQVTASRVYIDDSDLMKQASKEDRAILRAAAGQAKQIDQKLLSLAQTLSALGYAHGFDSTSVDGGRGGGVKDGTQSVGQQMPVEPGSIAVFRTKFTSGFDQFAFSRYRRFPQHPFQLAQVADESLSKTLGEMSIDQQSNTSEGTFQTTARNEEEVRKTRRSFDFSYRPELDSNLLARDGNKHFAYEKDFKKYWGQRYRLFSRLNDGILIDYDGWFSVTPERMAEHVADRVRAAYEASAFPAQFEYVVLDAFTGVGGNAIQFALAGAFVIAVDLDPVRLRCAAQNARVYGVQDRIQFVCGDFFQVGAGLVGKDLIDTVYLSPPWGGPSYLNREMVDLSTGICPDGRRVFELAQQISPNVVYFLPRNINFRQLTELAVTTSVEEEGEEAEGGDGGGRMEVEQVILNHKLKAVHAYFGGLVGELSE